VSVPGWRVILQQLARTAALVAVSGLLLYAAVAGLAQSRAGASIMTLALAAPLAGLLGFVAWDAWRKDEIAVWRRTIRRVEAPWSYWFNLLGFAAAALALASMAGWAGMAWMAWLAPSPEPP
jgi:hypothetical protein